MQRIPKVAIAAVAGALVGAITPAIAVTVVRYARNADRVDGFHAVAPSVARSERAGKVVATNRRGRFPNGVIRTAPNAAELGGRPPAAYEPTPCAANVAAHALVPANASSGDAVGIAFVHEFAGNDDRGRPVFGCDERDVTVAHAATGTYEIDFGGAARCLGGDTPAQMRASVTVKREAGEPLVANTISVCAGEVMLERVRVVDVDGTPTDASFVITLLGALPIPPIPGDG